MSALPNETAVLPSSSLVILRDLVAGGTSAARPAGDAAGARSETRSTRRALHIVSRSFPEDGENF